MCVWRINTRGEKEFRYGQEDWQRAALAASLCASFCDDVEDEQVADEAISCYNCRYRRWTPGSFTCMQTKNG